MSDTPRTDAAEHDMGSVSEPHYVVDVEVARQLERELARAGGEIIRLIGIRRDSVDDAKAVARTGREGMAEFIGWFVTQYPPRTIISDPEWHAPKIFRSVVQHIAAAMSVEKEGGANDATS